MHVQVYAAKELSEVERLAIEAAVVRGLAAAGKWKVSSGQTNATLVGGAADAKGALTDADNMLKDARAKVRQIELDKALSVAAEAVALYTVYLHKLIVRDGNAKALVDAHVTVATIEFLNGKEEAASKALLHAFVLDPSLSYTPKRFPPQLQELVMQEKALFLGAGKGSAKVTVNSPGVLYINGIKRASAPLVVSGLPAGPNVVTLVARGAKPTVKFVTVAGKATKEIAIAADSDKSKVQGVFAGSRGEVGEQLPGKKLVRAAKKVAAQGLLLVIPAVRDDNITLAAYVYDMRTKTKVGRFDTELEVDEVDDKTEKAAKLAAEVARSTRWRLVAGLTRPPSVPLWKKLYKHKYFWHAVGATAGVVLITAVAAAASGMSPGKRVVLLPNLVNF